MNYISDISGYV